MQRPQTKTLDKNKVIVYNINTKDIDKRHRHKKTIAEKELLTWKIYKL